MWPEVPHSVSWVLLIADSGGYLSQFDDLLHLGVWFDSVLDVLVVDFSRGIPLINCESSLNTWQV